MPYMLSQDGKCVHKKGADGSMGARVKCHDTAASAKEHMAALQANVSDAKTTEKPEGAGAKVYRPFTQEDTAYTTLHTNPVQACANCRFFRPSSWDDSPVCHIVEPYPEPILATGWCNEWRANAPPPEPEPMPVVIVADEVEINEGKEKMGAMTSHQKAAVWSVIEQVINWFAGQKTAQVGFKISDDGSRWEAFYTNNWRDDDGELFPEDKIDHFIARVKAGEIPWPDLQYAHLSGTTHGKADNLIRVGHHVLATGTFDDTDLASKFREHGRKCIEAGKPIALSHRFWYNPEQRSKTGEYADFETFEISWFEVLPGVKPANPLTRWEIKSTMTIPDSLMKNLEAIVGKQRAEQLVKLSADLDAQALAERRDAKTVKPDPAPDPGIGSKLDQVLQSMNGLDEKFSQHQTTIDKRVGVIETQVAALVQAQKTRDELAPPGSRNPAQKMQAGNPVGAYLDDQETKTAQGDRVSLVEFVLGTKINEEGVPTEIIKLEGQP